MTKMHNENNPKPEKKSAAREGLSWVLTLAGAVLAALVIRSFIATPVLVDGSSMHPTLENGELMFVTRFVRYIEPIRRGDVVIVTPPEGSEGRYYVKRVIGLPGDTVRVENGRVYVNGEALDEPYISEAPAYTLAQLVVGEGEYFLLGDNRNHSTDSHVLGTFAKGKIGGKAICVLYPFDKFHGV